MCRHTRHTCSGAQPAGPALPEVTGPRCGAAGGGPVTAAGRCAAALPALPVGRCCADCAGGGTGAACCLQQACPCSVSLAYIRVHIVYATAEMGLVESQVISRRHAHVVGAGCLRFSDGALLMKLKSSCCADELPLIQTRLLDACRGSTVSA